MEGTIDVEPITEPARGALVRVRWADEEARTGNRFAAEYKAETGGWKTWVEKTQETNLLFGAGSPVEASAGEVYKVRTRSLSSRDPSRRSGWSPPVTFELGTR